MNFRNKKLCKYVVFQELRFSLINKFYHLNENYSHLLRYLKEIPEDFSGSCNIYLLRLLSIFYFNTVL